jgi:hypothetical protein
MHEVILKQKLRVRLSGFDYFVLSGAMVNVLVIAYLIGYWLLAG